MPMKLSVGQVFLSLIDLKSQNIALINNSRITWSTQL